MSQKIEAIKLAANARSLHGSRNMRRMRKDGWLPGVVYGAKGQSRPIQLRRHEFELLLRNRAGENLIMDLAVDDDSPHKVLLKDVQRDHVRNNLVHVDFLEISMTHKLRVPVAIRLTGEPIGVTQEGGILEQLLRSVEVECLPSDIVREFVLDVATLKIGDSMFVRDLKLDPAKLTVLTSPDIAVLSVLKPHEEEEAKPAEEEAAAEAEAAAGPKEGEAESAEPEAKEKAAGGAKPEKGKEK